MWLSHVRINNGLGIGDYAVQRTDSQQAAQRVGRVVDIANDQIGYSRVEQVPQLAKAVWHRIDIRNHRRPVSTRDPRNSGCHERARAISSRYHYQVNSLRPDLRYEIVNVR